MLYPTITLQQTTIIKLSLIIIKITDVKNSYAIKSTSDFNLLLK